MAPDLLSHLPTRDIGKLLKSVKRYTRFVGLTKFVLIIVAIGLAGMITIFPMIKGDESGMRIMFSNLEKVTSEAPQMVNPRFEGVDTNNQPYTVTAQRAEQQDANTVLMHMIKADITLENQQWLAVHANEGKLEMNSKRLLLSGKVNVFYGEGYEFRTEQAWIDLNNGSATSNVAVEGQGPMGALRANGFVVHEKGQSIVFTGPVHLTIYQQENPA